MTRPILLAYQTLSGLSDSITGAMLVIAPAFTLSLMHLQAPEDALPYLSFIGAFVLAVGLSCLYGAIIMAFHWSEPKLQVVWLLTAMFRASVAILVIAQILQHTLEAGWITVAVSDGACVLIQAIGLRKGWLADAAR